MSLDGTDDHVVATTTMAVVDEPVAENGGSTPPDVSPGTPDGQKSQDSHDGDGDSGKDADTKESTDQHGSISFHPDSDATIQITDKSGSTNFDVNRFDVVFATVSTASPVLSKMLYRDDQETDSLGNQHWSMQIDADPKAVNTLLRIIHYQFHKVPANVTLDELFEITLLTSRLECTQLIFPWAHKWSAQFATYAGEDDRFKKCHKLIGVAWELGDAKLFRDMVDTLTVSSEVNAEGNIVNILGEQLKDMSLPPGVLDIVTDARTTTIGKILASIGSPLQELMSGTKDPSVKFCQRGKSETECETMMLGSAIPALAKNGLYPVPQVADYTKSISQLQDTINSINFIPYVGKEWMPHLDHGYCSLGFRDAARRYLEEMPIPFDHSITEHLKKQADLSGCNFKFNDIDDSVRLIKSGSTLVKDTWIDPRTKASRFRASAPSPSPEPEPVSAPKPAPATTTSTPPAPAPAYPPARSAQHYRGGKWKQGQKYNGYRSDRDVSVAVTPQPARENWG